MRSSLALTFAVAALAAGLAACGKSPTQTREQGGQAASSGQPASPAATKPAELSEAEQKAILASLPAPYSAGDLRNGKAKFAQCAACHTITPGGPNLTGPNLHGVFGRKAGSLPNYNYSAALKKADFTWDAAHLDRWLANPRTELPGNKMTFVGLRDPNARRDVIAYLMVHGSPRA